GNVAESFFMNSQSIWKAAKAVTVSVYFSPTDDFTTNAFGGLMWSGQLALGASSTFACAKSNPACNLTVAVDANGIVSLTSDVDVSGTQGNHFLVSVDPTGINLAECEWANTMSGHFQRPLRGFGCSAI